MKRLSCGLIPVILLLGLLSAAPASAQGRTDYFNVESPQVHPIEVARISGHDYLLICNTPDNSVEIWDTDESKSDAQRFLARVPTGLEPVSVRWHEELGQLFAVNFLGDSVTVAEVTADSGPTSLSVRPLATTWIGDEPTDLAFYSFEEDDGTGTLVTVHTFFATHQMLSSFGWYHAITLQPYFPGAIDIPAEVALNADVDFDTLDDSIALKEPRTLTMHCDLLWVLGFKGGNVRKPVPGISPPLTIDPFDFDLYSVDPTNGAATSLGGIATTNHNMRFSRDRLFLVGGEALNTEIRDEPNLKDAPTGFVKSMLYMVEDICTDPKISRRDLNLKPALQVLEPGPHLPVEPLTGPMVLMQPAPGPVGHGQAVSQPTDLELYSVDGVVEKIFVAGFGNDRLAVLVPNDSIPMKDWTIRRINISPVPNPPAPTKSMAGPRGLTIKTAITGNPDDPGARLYVMNRLDNSVTAIDPANEMIQDDFPLNHDPTPQFIHDGRPFLYDARKSGNGFDSCASCHTDGRTDALAWDLGTPEAMVETIPKELLDGPGFTVSEFEPDKEFLTTQSLQGLLNWDVPPSVQGLFTNAPYHWRADRADFTKFDAAFKGLLGGSIPSGPEMDAFEEFINTIHYPPNPKQPLGRVYTGSLGDPDDDDTTQAVSGDGALRGLKLYHILTSDGTGSCVHCHSLPEGSNNMLTDQLAFPLPHAPFEPDIDQVIETAALRGLFQREARRDVNGNSDPVNSPITGFEGLTHTGLKFGFPGQDSNGVATINAFNIHFFTGNYCQPPLTGQCENLRSLNQYIHELDWGTSPIAGVPYTISTATKNDPGTNVAFGAIEGQTQVANAGLAVQAYISGVQRGFWFDYSGATPIYREEPGGATFDQTALRNLLTAADDRLILMGTPLGSERRVAAPDGQPTVQGGLAPSAVELLPMRTNTANTDIPQLVKFWEAPGFVANPSSCPLPADCNELHGGSLSHTVRVYQYGLLQDSPVAENAFGLDAVRHEAPRRFRVAAKNLRHGARLHIFTHDDPTGGAPDPSKSLEGQDSEFLKVELPIYPTSEVREDGSRIWETAVELEPLVMYRMMLGGPYAPGIPATYTDYTFSIQEPPPLGSFDPDKWNWHWVEVKNPDTTPAASAGWQRLRIE